MDDIDVSINIGCDIDINTENEISILFRIFYKNLNLSKIPNLKS